VAGLEYAGLAVYYLSQPRTAAIDPLLTAPIQHGTRVLLVGCGLLAGIVSLQIRRQFLRALRSVGEQNRIVGMFGQHVSPAVVERLGVAPEGATPHGAIQVKGREQPVEVHALA